MPIGLGSPKGFASEQSLRRMEAWLKGTKGAVGKRRLQFTKKDNMWVEFKKVPSLMMAEMWKDTFESEGLPSRILPVGDILGWSETAPFIVYVPKGREHVAEEILRKL